jgi:hypothetical protein
VLRFAYTCDDQVRDVYVLGTFILLLRLLYTALEPAIFKVLRVVHDALRRCLVMKLLCSPALLLDLSQTFQTTLWQLSILNVP